MASTAYVKVAKFPRFDYSRLFGLLLLVGLFLNAACSQAQAPNVIYSAPLVITKGGTYTGNYKSTSSTVPAIAIQTTEPVILQNCTIVGPDVLIYADRTGTDLTVRECRGYGATPTTDNTPRGLFLFMLRGKNLVMEHNYLEANQGVILDRWAGNGSQNQTIKVRYNQAYNLDGRFRNNEQRGTASFLLLNNVTGIGNIEISWNQVINEPNKSSVSDIINFYDSGGVDGSVARVHDNYLQGSYPVPANSPTFPGSGFTTDGEGRTASTCTRFFRLDHNQFVSNCNGAINITVGRNGEIDNNRVVMSALLPDGTSIPQVYCGINPSNNYHKNPREAYGDHSIHDNVVGYVSHGPVKPFPDRFDIFDDDLAANAQYNITFANNSHLPNPITLQTERNEFALWQQKIQQNNVTPGLTGSTTPTTPTPTITTPTTPTPTTPTTPTITTPTTPTSPTTATFYRAFNINGTATTIDGNNWEAGSNLQVSGGTNFSNQSVTLTPATDATRATMLRSSAFGNRVKLTVPNVPNASYLVYLNVWEDNNAEVYSISVNGQMVKSNYNSGAAGHWERLGPYATTVTGGSLVVSTDGGTANCSGLEIWTAGTTPVVTPTTPTTPTPTPTTTTTSFYRAINLNGEPLTIDGNNWEGKSAPSYSASGASYALQSQQLNPSTDANRATMIRSCLYSNRLEFQLSAVPSGTYQVYVYVWEDNYPETFSITLGGQTVASKLSTGNAGSWQKLGPYQATVTNGIIQLALTGGTVNLSGVEVWRQATSTSTVTSGNTTSRASDATTSTAKATASPVTLYPNPLVGSQSQVQIEATVPEAQKVQVQLLTKMGVVVKQATLQFEAGTSTQTLTVDALPQGTYLVRFVNGSLAGTAIGLVKGD